MAITWTSIQNNENGLSVRTKINNFNALVANMSTAVDSLGTTTSTNTTAIATNTANIVNNTTDIATNTTDIAALTATVTEQSTYKYTTVSNVSAFTETYSDVINSTYTSLPSGTYRLSLSMMHNYNSTTTSAHFRFSLDGGTTWVEISKESKDVTEIMPTAYFKIMNITTGSQQVIIQAKTSSASDTLTIYEMTAMLEFIP